MEHGGPAGGGRVKPSIVGVLQRRCAHVDASGDICQSRCKRRIPRPSPTADLDDFASMGGAFGIGELSKAKEDWVLVTTARIDGKLHGFTFSTLERIGGTPCVLIGLVSVRRSTKRDQVLRALMRRPTTGPSWPSPTRTSSSARGSPRRGALEAFKELETSRPARHTAPSARSGRGGVAWPSASTSRRATTR